MPSTDGTYIFYTQPPFEAGSVEQMLTGGNAIRPGGCTKQASAQVFILGKASHIWRLPDDWFQTNGAVSERLGVVGRFGIGQRQNGMVIICFDVFPLQAR